MKIKKHLFMFLIPVLMLFAFSIGVYGNEIGADSGVDSALTQTKTEDVNSALSGIKDDAAFDEESKVSNRDLGAEKTRKESETDTDVSTAVSEPVIGDVNGGKSAGKPETQPTVKNSSTVKETEEKGIVEDGKKVTDVENNKSSDYTVEFTHNDLQYVLEGNKSVKLAKILEKVKIKGENVEKVECSDESLFSASKKSGEWIVTSHKPFGSQEWMKVTVDGKLYNITVTDDAFILDACTWARGYMRNKIQDDRTSVNMKVEWYFTNDNGQGSLKITAYDTDDTQIVDEGAHSGDENFFYVTKYQTSTDGSEITPLISQWLDKKLVKKVSIQQYVGNIAKHMFAACTNLTEVSIDTDRLYRIDANAFENATSLAKIGIPSTFYKKTLNFLSSSIGTNAFKGTPNNMEVYCDLAEDQLLEIANKGDGFASCFPNASNQKFYYKCGNALCYNIKNNVATIKKNPYVNGDLKMDNWVSNSPFTVNANSIKTLNISDATNIGECAFESCTKLTSVSISTSVTRIEWSGFWGCSALTSVNIPNSVTYIGQAAFKKCTSLATVYMANSVTAIAKEAFRECSSLSRFTISGGLTTQTVPNYVSSGQDGTVSINGIGVDAFKDTKNGAIFYCRYKDEAALTAKCDGGVFVNSFSNKDNQTFYYACGDDLFYSIASGTANVFKSPDTPVTVTTFPMWNYNSSSSPFTAQAASITSLNISGATSIGNYAFYNCENIIGNVTLPNSITMIGSSSFRLCKNMTGINLSDTSITDIPNQAFQHDAKLASVALPSGVTHIGWRSFNNCADLATVILPGTLANVVDGETTTYAIDSEAFYSIKSGAKIYYKNGNSGVAKTNPEADLASKCNDGVIANSFRADCAFYYRCGDTLWYTFNDNDSKVTISKGLDIAGSAMWDYDASSTPFYAKKDDLTTVNISDATTVGAQSFRGCTAITEFTLTASVKTLCDSCFKGCDGLTEVTIPGTVEKVEVGAFWKCQNMTSLTLGNGVKTVGASAFDNCGNLATVILPASITNIIDGETTTYGIGNTAFTRLKAGADIYYYYKNGNNQVETHFAEICYNGVVTNSFTYGLSDSNANHYNFHFYCGQNTFYTINSSGVVTIKAEPTGTATNLTTWDLKTDSTDAGHYYQNGPFYRHSKSGNTGFAAPAITSLILSEGIQDVGKHLFRDCTGLTSITFSSTVATVGEGAFYNCDGLTTFTVPATLANVNKEAFYDCSNLATVKIYPNASLKIGQDTFKSIKSGAKIYYYNGNSGAAKCNPEADLAGHCYNDLISNSFDTASVLYYQCGDNLWYTIDSSGAVTIAKDIATGADLSMWGYGNDSGTYSPFCRKGADITSISISDATTIGIRAFQSCSAVTSVTIPSSVTTLKDSCFKYCDGLTEVTIPGTVETIEVGAFWKCQNMTSLRLENGVKTIGASAFDNCGNLATVILPASITNTVDGETTTYGIGNTAFTRLKSGAKIYYENPGENDPIRFNPEADLASKCSDGAIENSFSTDRNYEFYYKCGNTLWYTFNSGNTAVTISKGLDIAGSAMWDYTNAGGSPFRTNATTLATVTVSDATNIGTYAFNGCTGVTSVTIPATVTTIGANAFNGCSALATVTIPTGVTVIGAASFTDLAAGADIYYAGKQAAFEPKCATSVANCFGYAVGAENGYLFHFTQSISYEPNEGILPDPLAPTSYETNGGNSVVLAVPTLDRYHFDGWCTDAALQTVPIKSFMADNTQFGDKTFYAKWTINPCAIIYYCGGGSIPNPTVTGYIPGSGETLTLDTPIYEGYAFRGWHQDELLSDDATLTFAVGDNTEDVSFYAEWYHCEPVTYWEDGELKTLPNYEVVKDCETTLGKEGQETWYVLVDDVDFNEDGLKRLTVLGDVHLVLNDGCELDSSGINVDEPNSLSVYAQNNDAIYNAPMDTSNVELEKMILLTNEYTVVGDKRYYRYHTDDSDYGEQDYFYNLETDTVYEYGRNGYELSPTLSKMEILAVPKNYPQLENGYVDDNGSVYTWNEENLQNDKGIYKPCQQDNSENGYVYFQGPYDDLELSAENTTKYFLGYFVDRTGGVYYLDHDDAVAPVDYAEGVYARNGDYVYSMVDPIKKYYYSDFNDGTYTFTYTDNGDLGGNEEVVTLTVGGEEGATYCYVGMYGVHRYPRDTGDEAFYLDPSDINEERYYPIISLGEYGDYAYHYIRHYFSKTLFRQPVQGVLYCLDDPTTNAAVIGSSDIDVSSGAITIYGGDIRILRDHSAVSLGSAGKTENNPNEVTTGDITINGGKLTYVPVVIGGGRNMSGGNIAIRGGQIFAVRIGAGADVDAQDDTTNLSIAWTNKTDFIQAMNRDTLSDFTVDDDHKFVRSGRLMIDGNSVVNSKEDLPRDTFVYLIPYYPVNYTMTIPSGMALPFGFVSGKFGTDDADSLNLATADDSSVATYPYGLSVIISKNHFSKITGRENNGNNIYDANNTLEYSLTDMESGYGSVNKCLIISNGNDHMNYVNGAESTLGGSDDMCVLVNDANKWNTIAPGFYGSNVTFTVGLSTAGCYPFDQEDISVFELH